MIQNLELKTPYFLIDSDELDKGYNNLAAALEKHWNNYIIGYSYKTNSLPWVVKYFDALGCFAEVVSEDEYSLGKLIGVKDSNFVYNGPIKTKESFLEALRNGCFVNIDSQREIDWLDDLNRESKCNIGIRANFDLEKFCPGESQCGDEGGRFGFCYENGELKEAIEKIRRKGFKISGLHLHESSKTRSLKIYEAIATIACEIAENYCLELDFIDIGGGFFGGMPGKPEFDEYIRKVAGILHPQFNINTTKLIVEPGMCLIGPPISYVTSVIDVKRTTQNMFVVTDGTRTHVDPLMSKQSYFYEDELVDGNRDIVDKQVVCGYTCMEHDRLFDAFSMPEYRVGDRIVYHKVGAYTMCLSPLFIRYFPDVYVQKAGSIEKVREHWTAKEYAQKANIMEKDKKSINILILAAGTRNKIVQYFKRDFDGVGTVVATDASELGPAIYDADKYYIVPNIKEPGYIEKILKICRDEQITGVLSLIDPELSLLAENEERFKKIGTTVIGSTYNLCEMALDKMQMYQWLVAHGYNCARSWMDKDEFYKAVDAGEVTYPVFVKPYRGSASISISKVYDKETVDLLFAHEDDLMIQEFLNGQEIGADVYIDMISGEVVSIFTKKKIKMRAGETDKAVSFKDYRLFDLIEKFVTEAGYRGQIDIDIFDINGQYYISEVNPRFGGGYPHAYECGCNHMRMILENLKGNVNAKSIGKYEEGIYMMKYNEVKIRGGGLAK